jgi:uncharacterized protein YaaN involved in tellurite resistance
MRIFGGAKYMKTIPQSLSDNMETIRAINAEAKRKRQQLHQEMQEAVDAYFKPLQTFNVRER